MCDVIKPRKKRKEKERKTHIEAVHNETANIGVVADNNSETEVTSVDFHICNVVVILLDPHNMVVWKIVKAGQQ